MTTKVHTILLSVEVPADADPRELESRILSAVLKEGASRAIAERAKTSHMMNERFFDAKLWAWETPASVRVELFDRVRNLVQFAGMNLLGKLGPSDSPSRAWTIENSIKELAEDVDEIHRLARRLLNTEEPSKKGE